MLGRHLTNSLLILENSVMVYVRPGRVSSRYLFTLRLLWAFFAVAQDAGPAPAGGDDD